ncbi:hypothetical protein DPMN_095865 [Dreissena polymorpha]|uniref:Uncharacterized protein n=1 Tax=Dreissena polymorpha TaxID=45954 RepID=A0A9D4L7P6_DREPO|nr:hypothetical protein DPMN_095865 [Dreissena polymorpha]
MENCPAPWRPCFFTRDINETNVLTNIHDDWAKIVTSRVFTRNTAPPPGGHVFQGTGSIFELNQHIIYTNILTNFELNRTIYVAFGVFTRQKLTAHNGQQAITKVHHEHVVLR